MFRITWVCTLTGVTGHGDAVFTEENALEKVRILNKKLPDLTHAVEKYEQPKLTLNVKGHRCSYGDLTFVAQPSPKVSETPKPLAPLAPLAPLPSLPLAQEPVCQPQSSPPPSDFSTSFF